MRFSPLTPIRCLGRATLALLVALPAFVCASGLVSAHTLLLSSDPPEGGTVSQTVSAITLTFDENPQPGFTKITIYDTKQRPVTTVTDPATGPTPNVLIVPAPTLGTDSYALVWQMLSADGHVARGAFTFTVQLPGEAQAAPPPELSTVLSASANNPPTLSVLLAGVRYVGLGALTGGVGVLLLCFLPALTALTEKARKQARLLLDRRVQRWLFVAFGAVLAAHLLILLTQAAKATNSGLLDALSYDLLSDLVRETTFGAVWRVQAIALLLLGEWLVLLPATGRVRFAASRRGVGITAHPPQTTPVATKADAEPVPVWAWGVALTGGLFLLGTTAFGGHAAAVVAHPALALLSDWAHLAAMSLWFGGVLLLVGLLPGVSASAGVDAATTGRRVTTDAVSRFSRLALLTIGVVTVSGIYNATQHTSLETLTATGYGLALVGKIALVGCVLLVAAANRWLVVPALRKDAAGDGDGATWAHTLLLRLVGAEVLLGLGVLGLTGLLTQLPPAYKPAPPPAVVAATAAVAEQSEVVASVPTLTLGDVRATLDVNARGSSVAFAARVTDPANRPRADVERVTLLLDSGDRDVGTITVPMARADDGQYTASGGWFSNGQHWLARLVVSRAGAAATTLNFALLPRPVPRADTNGAANAFPWPRFEAAAGIGAVLVLLGLAVALAVRYAPVPFGARERWAYTWGGVALLVAGMIVAGWFSTVAMPLIR